MRHSLARIEAPKAALGDNCRLYNLLLDVCHKEGLSVLQSMRHEFYPHGLTAIVLLAESHVAIHTYPELNLVYLDAFTCGATDPELVARAFALALELSVGVKTSLRVETLAR